MIHHFLATGVFFWRPSFLSFFWSFFTQATCQLQAYHYACRRPPFRSRGSWVKVHALWLRVQVYLFFYCCLQGKSKIQEHYLATSWCGWRLPSRQPLSYLLPRHWDCLVLWLLPFPWSWLFTLGKL